MINYARYCADCEKFNMENPYKDEADFNREYGIDQHKEPLILTPRNQKRPMRATIDNHISHVAKKVKETTLKKIRAVKPPKQIKGPKPPKTNREMSPKTTLKGMTDEQIKEHRRSQNRIWKAKQKLKNPPREKTPPLTHEERKARARARYHERKPTITRIFYKDLTPEELAAHLKEQRRLHTIKTKEQRKAYREANKEKYKEYGKEWARKNADKRRESNRKYIEANKEKVAAQRKAWNEKNKEKRREINNRADAKRRGKKENICTLQEAS